MQRKGQRQVGAPTGARLIPAAAAAAACALLAAGVGTASATAGLKAAPGAGATPTPTVALHQGANVFVTLSPAQVNVGGSVTVTFTLTIFGDVGPQTYWIIPTLPPGTPASALPAGCTPMPGCPMGQGTTSSGSTDTLQLTLTPTAAGQYPISGQVEIFNGDGPYEQGPTASAELTVLQQPTIRVLPPVAGPGSVVLVYGTGFPPGEAVQLAWNPGITAAATPPVAGPDGTFVAQMLILGGDLTGERTVVVTGAGFGQVTAPFLVTKPRLLPPLLGAGTGTGSGTGPGSGTGTGG